MRRFFLTLPVLLFGSMPVSAFDDSDRAGVEQAVADFEAAFVAGNWEAILPPDRIFEVLAELTDREAELLKYQSLQQIDEMMSDIEIVAYNILTDDLNGGTSDAGAGYAFMPTVMEISVQGGPVRDIESVVLAAELDEGWRLFRIDSEQQWLLFLRAYPHFEGIAPGQ